MVYQSQINTRRKTKKPAILAVVFCCLLLCVSQAWAASHTVFGQVFKVSSKEAADESIAVSSFQTEKFPFVHIKIYNRGTGAFLAEGDAGINGQYSITFTASGAAPNVDMRVYKNSGGGYEKLQEARPELNWVNSLPGFSLKKLLVISDDIIDYKDESFSGYPGVGLVFTRTGEVPTQYIAQSIAAGNNRGLADVPGTAPSYVPRFEKAPFGRTLKIFGDFGSPSAVCPYSEVDWYRVTITNLGTTTSFTLKDYLSKLKTVIVYSYPLTITNHSEKIGPFDGEDAINPAVTHDGLYKVTKSTTDTFYAFPDLRILWNTGGLSGLFEISIQYYKEVPGGTATKPRVYQLNPTTCFDGVPPATLTTNYAINKMLLRINNQPLDVDFVDIFLKNGGYYTGGGSTPVDFNDPANKCSILDLNNQYGIEIHFKAQHTGQYMKNWSLSAVSNNGATVSFGSDTFAPHITAANPTWNGTASTTLFKAFANWDTCAYIFDLIGWSRVQNGYHYVQRVHKRRTYYVQKN
jgi:hypothetical protein